MNRTLGIICAVVGVGLVVQCAKLYPAAGDAISTALVTVLHITGLGLSVSGAIVARFP